MIRMVCGSDGWSVGVLDIRCEGGGRGISSARILRSYSHGLLPHPDRRLTADADKVARLYV